MTNFDSYFVAIYLYCLKYFWFGKNISWVKFWIQTLNAYILQCGSLRNSRVSVAKTLILPKLNHLFISLPTPNRSLLSTFGNALFQFLWKSRRTKVKRKNVRQNVIQDILRRCYYILWFYLFFQMLTDKRLTVKYKLWMDNFITINSSGVVSKILDFGDSFIKKMMKQNNFFGKMFYSQGS